MALIEIEGMEFFAYHGCFKEEQVTGNDFIVDLSIRTDVLEASISDDLKQTIDYQAAYLLVKAEMEINSALLEHVARRILIKLKESFTEIDYAEVKISKLNPALGGRVAQVSVSLCTEEM